MPQKWGPNSEPQESFHLQTDDGIYECLFGGTKGPGKTESILREAIRQVHIKGYRAILFRRTNPRLGEIIDRSHKYFKGMGAKYSGMDNVLQLPAWTFPSGAKVAFGHLQHEKDKHNYQGKEFHYIGFDQLEEFTESQYLYIIAQNRTSDPSIRCYIRSTANPGGVGHAWVKKRFIDVLKPGIPGYFKRIEDEDIETSASDPHALSRSFIPASVYDNPHIIQNDPGYVRRLQQMSEQDKQAFLFGNWEIFKGQFFREWRRSLHVKLQSINPAYIKFISLDYGYGAPSCVLWWQVDYDGNLHAYRELYKEGYTYEALARKIIELTPREEAISYCVADPAIWGDKSHHKDAVQGESGAETMQRIWAGFTSLIKADNERITGWGRMRIMLTPKDGVAALTYSPLCTNAIRTIPAMVHDDSKVEDLNSEGEDHAADSSRYGVMSRPIVSVRPEPKPQRKSLEWYEQQEEALALRKAMEEAA